MIRAPAPSFWLVWRGLFLFPGVITALRPPIWGSQKGASWGETFEREGVHDGDMKYASPSAGFTILEILVVIAILGILVAISIINYNQFRRPEREAAQIIYGSLARLRAEAMSNTDSRRLILLSTGVLSQQRALSCGSTEDTWTSLGDVNFSDVTRDAVPPPFTLSQTPISGVVDPTLPAGAKLVACFTPRGQAAIPTGLPTGQINVVGKRAVRVEVALGGGMKINGYNP